MGEIPDFTASVAKFVSLFLAPLYALCFPCDGLCPFRVLLSRIVSSTCFYVNFNRYNSQVRFCTIQVEISGDPASEGPDCCVE